MQQKEFASVRKPLGARKGYNPQHRGKRSYQPILTFLAETREYLSGELRKGERPTGKQIAAHLEGVFAALPKTVERVYARADSGFYCGEAVAAYEKHGGRFVLSAQKTPRLVEQLQAARWTGCQSVHAATSLGSGSRAIARSHPGHRHDDTNGVRSADGRAKATTSSIAGREAISPS